ncbi:hypothetical protein BGZ88_007822 [Linnemannia elongata]|nr:hypothetical protein BGZ88_007822 [Linnemannia elongata]
MTALPLASRNHKLPSEGSEHYDDKDQYCHSIPDAKYVTDSVTISGVTVAKPRYSSTYSSEYAAPLPSPQVATFARDLAAGLPQSQSQTNLVHLNGKSLAAIELETRPFLKNSQEFTTTTVAIDSSRRLSNEAKMLGSVAVSQPSNDSDGSELRKIQSLHVRGSETLPLLPQLPAAATMEGSRSPAVAISSISHNASSSSSLYSLTSPRSPSSPKSSKTVRNGRAARLKLKVSSSPTSLQPHQDRQLPPPIQILPTPFISTSTSPCTPASLYSSTSRSSNSMPGSPSSYGGGYSNSSIDRKLPAGFASSPAVITTERFE